MLQSHIIFILIFVSSSPVYVMLPMHYFSSQINIVFELDFLAWGEYQIRQQKGRLKQHNVRGALRCHCEWMYLPNPHNLITREPHSSFYSSIKYNRPYCIVYCISRRILQTNTTCRNHSRDKVVCCSRVRSVRHVWHF
jgi:hypothetical protein